MNYWLTLPFLGLLASLCVAFLLVPHRFRSHPWPVWARRLQGAVVLVGVVWFAIGAVQEARDRPNCEPTENVAPASGGETS